MFVYIFPMYSQLDLKFYVEKNLNVVESQKINILGKMHNIEKYYIPY